MGVIMEDLKLKKMFSFLNSGDIISALYEIEKMVEVEPENTVYLYHYAEVLARTSDEKNKLKAVEIYKNLSMKLNRNYNYKIGMLYMQVGKDEKAIKRFNREKNRYPNAKYQLAKLTGKSGKHEEALIFYEQLENEQKEDPWWITRILNQEKRCYVNLKKLPEFRKKLFKYLENEKIKDFVYELIAETYYIDGKYEEAKKYYLINKNSNNNYLKNLHLGDIYFAEEDYDEAIKYYSKCLELIPVEKKSFIFVRISNCYLELKDLKEAKKYMEAALRVDKNKQNYLKLGKIEVLLHEEDKENIAYFSHLFEARQIFELGVYKFPDDIFLKFELAKVQIMLSNYRTGRRLLEEIINETEDRFAYIELAKLNQIEKKFKSAIGIYEKLLQVKEDIYIRLELGKAYTALNRYDEAIREFDKILELTNNKDKCAIIEKTRVLKLLGKFDEAEKVIELSSDNQVYYAIEKSSIEFLKGNYEISKKILLDELSKEPTNTKLLLNLARIEKDLGNYGQAINIASRVEKLEKNNSSLYLMAQCYEALEMIDDAIEYYNKLIHSSNFYIESHLSLAELFYKLGDLQKAYYYAYPIVDTLDKEHALAIMFAVERNLCYSKLHDKYYDDLSDVNKEYVEKVIKELQK